MKRITLILLFLLSTQFSYGQWIHFWLKNKDKKTRDEMTKTVAATSARLVEEALINNDLKNSKKHLATMINRYYTNNSYDDASRNDYLSTIAISGAFAGITTAISKNKKAMYMTANKKAYIDKLNLGKLGIIAAIKSVDVYNKNNPSIKSDNRQEIYRLRAELLRSLSQNDKTLRQLLVLTIAAGVIDGDTELIELIDPIDIIR